MEVVLSGLQSVVDPSSTVCVKHSVIVAFSSVASSPFESMPAAGLPPGVVLAEGCCDDAGIVATRKDKFVGVNI